MAPQKASNRAINVDLMDQMDEGPLETGKLVRLFFELVGS